MPLERFITAQEPVWAAVTAELRAGKKRTHWMWFIFPQLAGLGRSPTAMHFAIADIAEAKPYVQHPVLGARLRQASALMLSHKGTKADAILGPVDAAKLRSSMTLFAMTSQTDIIFADVLHSFYLAPDPRSIALLS
ncbi:MAG: DUF1810 domain-containing protein [Rhodobacteraceae bacterium]|nr:DUF1810 domain-containing protein [Paracoccaceae bacterium]